MKKVLVCVLILLLPLTCCACAKYIRMELSPCQQLNTTWASDDGTITFTVGDDYRGIGKMMVDGETIEILVVNDFLSDLHIYPISVLEKEVFSTNDIYENWECSYKSDKQFTARVKETTFFSVDQKFVFHRQNTGDKKNTGDGSACFCLCYN